MDTQGHGQTIGNVIAIRDSRVTLELAGGNHQARVTYGNYLGIETGSRLIVAVVTALTCQEKTSLPRAALADLDLLGEIVGGSERSFSRGVTTYPAIGDEARILSASDLLLIYKTGTTCAASIGVHAQDSSIPANIKVDDLLAKHFAVLGATGVGKSSGVAVIVDAVLRARPDIRAFLLDVHNEYAGCFESRANVINPRSFKLPFWLFNLEELTEVIYGGRQPVGDEIDILAELVPAAKTKYAQYKEASDRQILKRSSTRGSGFTIDTPVPYLLQDLLARLIHEDGGSGVASVA